MDLKQLKNNLPDLEQLNKGIGDVNSMSFMTSRVSKGLNDLKDKVTQKIDQTRKSIDDFVDGAAKTMIAVGEVGINAINEKSVDEIASDLKKNISSKNSQAAVKRVIEHLPIPQLKEDSFGGSVTPGIVEPSFSYVGNILVNDTVSFDPHYFNKIYNQIPESLCQSYIIALDDIRKCFPNRDGSSWTYENTYEDILKHYMWLAADVSILGVADFIKGLVDFFTKISIPIPSVQTMALSMIWASLIYDLEKKHSSTPEHCEKNKIAKMCIGLLGFVSQVVHREAPLWNWIGTVYKTFAMAGDYIKESPYLYQKIFPNKVIDIKEFPNWHKELEKHIDIGDKVTIGKAFNICYTFRVGDIYLHSVLNSSSYFDDKLKERLVDSLWPIPRERDIMRVLDLYTKPHIY